MTATAAPIKYEWDRLPIIIKFAEVNKMAETYGFVGTQGHTYVEGQRLVPRNKPSDTVYIFMHPSSTLHLLPMPAALADAAAAGGPSALLIVLPHRDGAVQGVGEGLGRSGGA
jgi:hypothetical protein